MCERRPEYVKRCRHKIMIAINTRTVKWHRVYCNWKRRFVVTVKFDYFGREWIFRERKGNFKILWKLLGLANYHMYNCIRHVFEPVSNWKWPTKKTVLRQIFDQRELASSFSQSLSIILDLVLYFSFSCFIFSFRFVVLFMYPSFIFAILVLFLRIKYRWNHQLYSSPDSWISKLFTASLRLNL